MFKKDRFVELGQANSISGKEAKNLIKYVSMSFDLEESEVVGNIFLKTKPNLVKIKLPRKMLLYALDWMKADGDAGLKDVQKYSVVVSKDKMRSFLFIDMNSKGDIFPLLPTLGALTCLKTVEVYSPASKFIINGADVMLPGILNIENIQFEKNEKVCVKVKGNPFPFCFGKFVISSATAADQGFQGKGIEVYHCFLDSLWKVTGSFAPDGFSLLEKQVLEAESSSTSISDPKHGSLRSDKLDQLQSNKDYLLEETFRHVLEKKKLKRVDLPILVSNFYSNILLPSRPKDTTIEIKKTRYKKVSVFLAHMEELGVLKLAKEDELEKIIDFDLNMLDNLSTESKVGWKKTQESGHVDELDTPNTEAATIQVKYFYKSQNLPGMEAILGPWKSKYLTMSDVKQSVLNYITAENLVDEFDKSKVIFDPVLFHLNRKKTGNDIGFSTRSEITKVVQNCMNKCHQITKADGTVSAVKHGDPPKIKVFTKRRQGNKHVTKVQSLEAFGIVPARFASTAQTKFSCSTSTQNISDTSSLKEVIIQGNKSRQVSLYLQDLYGLRSDWIDAK